MISRQAAAGYERDLDRIRDRVRETPLVVGFDAERRLFVLSLPHDSQPLMKGRYQVINAYVSGYLRGHLARDAGAP